MPELCRFFGITVLIYFDDHSPPHFHVRYNDDKASISINDLAIVTGNLSPRTLGLVKEWAELHRAELLDNWNMIKDSGKYFKIDPLT